MPKRNDSGADLPETWVEYATGGQLWEERPRAAESTDIRTWLRALPRGPICSAMRTEVERGIADIESEGGGAHDIVNSKIYSLLALGVEGHHGVRTALKALKSTFIELVTVKRREARAAGKPTGSVRSVPDARNEWNRSLTGAALLLIAQCEEEPELARDDCGCLKDGAGIEPAATEEPGAHAVYIPKLRDPAEYVQNDDGNAEHLLALVRGQLRYVPKLTSWAVWDAEAGRWALGADNLAVGLARALATRIAAAAHARYKHAGKLERSGKPTSDVEEEREIADRLQKWAVQCGNRSRLAAMLEVAQSYPGVTTDAELFDADPRMLHCPNGILYLEENGWRFDPEGLADKELMLSRSTGTAFVEGADSRMWKQYLDTFLPDLEARWYLQKVTGYALLGANPARLLFFLHGPTSSGKSTFVEMLKAVTGEYAGTFNMSLFRESQDERPRPDLVEAMQQRIITTTEAGAEWVLHADMIKRLTGFDELKARVPYAQRYIERVPAFTPLICNNAIPRIPGADRALWRRMVAIPFDIELPEGQADETVTIRMLRSERCRRAVLAWAVEGWAGYVAEGIRLRDAPDAVVNRTLLFRQGASDIEGFLSEVCDFGPEYTVPLTDLYDAYEAWAYERRLSERERLNMQRFSAVLTGFGYETARVSPSSVTGAPRKRGRPRKGESRAERVRAAGGSELDAVRASVNKLAIKRGLRLAKRRNAEA